MVEVVRTDDFDKWLRKLKDRQGKLRIAERIDRLAHGNPGDVKPIGRGISELRLTYGPGYRVYYLQDDERLILLLCGGDKSTQQKDIEKAQQLADEWRSEEDEDDGNEECEVRAVRRGRLPRRPR
jgi:putative addiction module killer protein